MALSLIDKLEELIDRRKLSPGQRLPSERQLSAEFGVSRSSLREAIQQLISRGIVVSRRGGGTFVAGNAAALPLDNALKPLAPLMKVDKGYWRDIMEIRKSLDTDAAYYAAMRATPADKERLQSILATISSSGQSPAAHDPAKQAMADTAFHMAIAQASQNLVLRQVVEGLSDLLHNSIRDSLAALYHKPRTVEMLDRQHIRIAKAIFSGQPDEARQAALDHLVFVEDSLRHIEDETERQRRASAITNSPFQEGTRS